MMTPRQDDPCPRPCAKKEEGDDFKSPFSHFGLFSLHLIVLLRHMRDILRSPSWLSFAPFSILPPPVPNSLCFSAAEDKEGELE